MNQYLAMEKQLLSSQTTEDQNFVWPIVPNNGFGTLFRDQKYYTTNLVHHE